MGKHFTLVQYVDGTYHIERHESAEAKELYRYNASYQEGVVFYEDPSSDEIRDWWVAQNKEQDNEE